jgi:hypothetical protein
MFRYKMYQLHIVSERMRKAKVGLQVTVVYPFLIHQALLCSDIFNSKLS